MLLKFTAGLICLWFAVARAEPTTGIAMHGTPKYAADFTAFEYVNPDAPRGGLLRQATYGSFDTFNPWTVMGNTAPGIGLVFDTLMKQSLDEPFSLYGLIAESIDVDTTKSRVTFRLNPQARFADGAPITAADVLFSFERLRDKGLPMYRLYYRDVTYVETPDDRTVVFEWSPDKPNRELPLILGELPVLPKTFWEPIDWSTTLLTKPLGSGPYIVDDFEPGRFVTYRRNPEYWAQDLNVNRGAYNFDTIRFDVYRDTTVATEALKAGLIDIRLENEAKKWEAALESEAVRSGRLVAQAFPHRLPSGMQGFVYNTRRPLFADPRVRQALAYAFDFDWTNKHLFHNAYRRTSSYFDNSFLKSEGLPSPDELALLESYREHLPPAVFDTPYKPPQNDGSIRPNLQKALDLLKSSGWQIKDGTLVNQDNIPFRFELLIDAPSATTWERVILPFTDRLKRLGITADIRAVDAIQYKNRLDNFDFDMTITVWGQSLSPGNEQRYFWGSAAANTPGSWNYSGIQNPAVDALIEKIISADTPTELRTATRALDRVLLHSYLVIPHWHAPEHRYLYTPRMGKPDTTPMKGVDILLWWDTGKEKKE